MNQIALAIAGAFLFGTTIGGVAGFRYEAGRKAIELLEQKQVYQKSIDDANKRKQEIEAKVTELEHKAAKDIAGISEDYQGKLKEKNDQLEKAIASQRVIGKRLYINAKPPACNSSEVSSTTTGAGRRDGKTRIELPRNVAERLIRRANTADEIVEQLNSCQRIIIQDREIINGGNQNQSKSISYHVQKPDVLEAQ